MIRVLPDNLQAALKDNTYKTAACASPTPEDWMKYLDYLKGKGVLEADIDELGLRDRTSFMIVYF